MKAGVVDITRNRNQAAMADITITYLDGPDIACAAVFPAARAGEWMTGQTIVIDGGWAVGRGA